MKSTDNDYMSIRSVTILKPQCDCPQSRIVMKDNRTLMPRLSSYYVSYVI